MSDFKAKTNKIRLLPYGELTALPRPRGCIYGSPLLREGQGRGGGKEGEEGKGEEKGVEGKGKGWNGRDQAPKYFGLEP